MRDGTTAGGANRGEPGDTRERGIRRFIPATCACAALLLLLGCGQKFDLPPQPEPSRIPTPGTYNYKKTWYVDSPTDMVSQGSYLYVVEREETIHAYFTEGASPIRPQFVAPFDSLVRPVHLALAKADSTFLFVADEGDGTHPASVKKYYFLGGAPRATFIDSVWTQDSPDGNVEFAGLAADPELNIYLTLAGRDSVLMYDATGTRLRVLSDGGEGLGYVRRPRGLQHNGTHLVVADTQKDRVQRLRTDEPYQAVGEAIGVDLLHEPWDVSVDRLAEFVFVADSGRDRVLKFLKTGAFVDTVYSQNKPQTALDDPIIAPRYIAVEDPLVFVADPTNARIVAFQLTSQ